MRPRRCRNEQYPSLLGTITEIEPHHREPVRDGGDARWIPFIPQLPLDPVHALSFDDPGEAVKTRNH